MADAIRFYADVHVPRSVTLPEHLARATSEGRVLVTQDADFLALHASGVAHTGIAYTRQGAPIGKWSMDCC